MPNVADVIVVGFGPVGAVLAALLGRAGIQTVVIDKADDVYHANLRDLPRLYYDKDCQTAREVDPRSAPNLDPSIA